MCHRLPDLSVNCQVWSIDTKTAEFFRLFFHVREKMCLYMKSLENLLNVRYNNSSLSKRSKTVYTILAPVSLFQCNILSTFHLFSEPKFLPISNRVQWLTLLLRFLYCVIYFYSYYYYCIYKNNVSRVHYVCSFRFGFFLNLSQSSSDSDTWNLAHRSV